MASPPEREFAKSEPVTSVRCGFPLKFIRLAPPPEPPALLLALEGDEGASSPEDAMLVIDDDRQTYDPDVPTSPPPSPEKPVNEKEENEQSVKPEKCLNLPPVDISSIRLPSPEVDIDDCPNRVMYSAASVNIARQTKSDSESDKETEIGNAAQLVGRISLEPVAKKTNNTEVIKDDKQKIQDTEIDSTSDSVSKIEITDDKVKPEEDKHVDSEKYDPEISDNEQEQHSSVEDQKVDETAEDSVTKSGSGECDEIHDDKMNDTKHSEEEKEDKKEEVKEEIIEPEKVKEEAGKKDELLKVENKEIKTTDMDNVIKEEKETEIKNENKDSDVKDKVDEVENELKKEESENIVKLSKSEIDDTKPASPEGHVTTEEEKNDESEEKENCVKKTPEFSKTQSALSETDEKTREADWSPESTPPRKNNADKEDQEGEDVLELGVSCGEDERDGLVDITDEEISTYEKNWELEDNQASTEKTAGLEGLDTEAISDCEYNLGEDGQPIAKVAPENGPKEEGEIISDEKRVPVAWKKITKAKERSYREKDTAKEKNKKKEKKPKEKRKELERYDVRKIISDKPKKRRVDEFGRDISPSRSRSLSDSRSRSVRSLRSIRSRRSRSRSRSKKRRSRDRKSRNRSRVRSRGRSRSPGRNRVRSRDRSKRRGRSKSRSRSDSRVSRRRRSRSPRKNKERRSRGKSRDKKRRKRDSSISCSSCSCSSCERDNRKNKKLTVIVPNKPVSSSGKSKKKSKYKERGEQKRRRVDSPVPSKEVFTSGDNILVSVNFKSSKSGELSRKETSSKKKKDDEPRKKKDKSSKENQPLRSIVSKSSSNQQSQRKRINARNLKPVAIIDLAQSPFREQTLSPKEVIVLTDSDSDDKRKNDESSLPPCQVTGPKTPPEPHIKFNIISSKPQILRSLANPLLDSGDQLEGEGEEEEDERVELPHKGPNTPPEPPVPYDPFEPTKSRSPTPLQELEESRNPPTPPGDKILPPEPIQRPASPPKPPPETPKTPSPLHSPPPKPQEDNPPEKAPLSPPNNCNDDSMDMGGGDSPYSPGSSDGEDLFEPPLPQITTPAPISKTKSRNLQKHIQKLTPSPLKRKPAPNKTSTPLKNNKGKKESVGLKLDEDQLKILDDLPNSAVEMQVKDKFLKKLNRQERVVEEVKMVLKPHYAKKHVNKEEYKEILRKSVPKICHSRSGEINPMKIQRLIEAYVKKYRHLRRKRKMTSNFTAPESIPLLKPKPKATMWC